MKASGRIFLDKVFTAITGLSVILLVIVLLVILGPMLRRGLSAVAFKGTVEFRKMQLAEFGKGDESAVQAEAAKTENTRKTVYETIDKFKSGVDFEELTDRAKDIHRDFGKELQRKGVSREEYTELRSLSREIRNKLTAAFSSSDIGEINEHIEYILKYKSDARFKGTGAS